MSSEARACEVVVGVVGRPWGRRGQFLLDPLGTDPGFLLLRGKLRLRRKGDSATDHQLLKSHVAGGRLVVQVEGCDTVEEAEAWRGAKVVLGASEFAPAPPGSYYPHELIGLEVVLTDGRPLGRVERLLRTAGPDLLLVRSVAKEYLVPFAEAICSRVDPAAGRIEIDPPEGLLELD